MVPVLDAYCTDHPARLTGALPRLYNSMKSFFSVAPELPPPPYTWLMTTSVDTAVSGPTAHAMTLMIRAVNATVDRPRTSRVSAEIRMELLRTDFYGTGE